MDGLGQTEAIHDARVVYEPTGPYLTGLQADGTRSCVVMSRAAYRLPCLLKVETLLQD